MLGHWGGAPLHGKVVRFQFCCYVGVSDCVQVICLMFVCVLIMKYDQNGIDNDTQRPREQGKVKKTRLVYYTQRSERHRELFPILFTTGNPLETKSL